MANLLRNGNFESATLVSGNDVIDDWEGINLEVEPILRRDLVFGDGPFEGDYFAEVYVPSATPPDNVIGGISQGDATSIAALQNTTVTITIRHKLDGEPDEEIDPPYPFLTVILERIDNSQVLYTSPDILGGGKALEWEEFVSAPINVGAATTGIGVPLKLKILLNGNESNTDTFWLDAIILDGTPPDSPLPPPTVPPQPACPPRAVPRYAVWLRSPTGQRLALLKHITGMNWTHVVCGIGRFELTMPNILGFEVGDSYIVEIRRSLGQWSQLEFLGFVEVPYDELVARRARPNSPIVKEELLTLSGTDANGLLSRRIVPIAAESTGGTLTGMPIDNMMKALVRRHMGSGAESARQFGSMFSVAADASAGPTTTRTVALRNVFEMIRELWEASQAENNEVFFEVEPTTATSFTFRTATGQLKSDLRETLRFGSAYRNLVKPFRVTNYAESANVIYHSFGAGVVLGAIDETNPWARREVYEDTRTESQSNGAVASAKATLARLGAKEVFGAELLDAPNARYGCAWKCGDRIRAWEFGKTWDAIIRTVTVSVDGNGRETVSARIEAAA